MEKIVELSGHSKKFYSVYELLSHAAVTLPIISEHTCTSTDQMICLEDCTSSSASTVDPLHFPKQLHKA